MTKTENTCATFSSHDDAELPLTSVIVTTYGDCSTLSRAVDSVLCQTYPNVEIIVVDDNGDGAPYRLKTEQVMARYNDNNRVVYLKHAKNMNGSAARNTGIERARGSFISFLDNDDVLLSRRIENAVAALSGSNAGACFCDVLLVVNGCYSGVKTRQSLAWKDILLGGDCFGTGSNLFFRKDVVEGIGPFDVSFRRNQDIEYVLRVLLGYEAVWSNTLDIVKSANSTDNAQKFDAYVKTKEHFDDVFRDVIGRLDAGEETRRRASRARELLYFASKEGNPGACKDCLKTLRELGCPAGKATEVRAFLSCYGGPLANGIEAAARRLKHDKVKKSLGAEVNAEISKWFS